MRGDPTDPRAPTLPHHTVADATLPSPDREVEIEEAHALLAQLPTVSRAHYEILHALARGGIGKISVARDLRLGRRVAIKELRRASRYAEMRFAREVRIGARLQHPNIVPVHEAGRWTNGEPFLVMKLVKGKSLDEAIGAAGSREARMQLLRHVTDVADAIAYAHSEGIVHRDLKPANVLVGPFGETVVIDWGLAKDMRAPEEPELPAPEGDTVGDHYKTTDGVVLGTPSFMPPEQAAAAAVDERADVYALGAILYQVLSGRAPYDDAPASKVLAHVLSRPPAPLDEIEPHLPRDLLAIVEKAMAREPERRYPSAREMAAELQRFASGGLVTAHQYSLSELTKRFVRRHRAAVAIGALAATLLGALGGFSFVRIARERDAAESARARAEESALSEARMREQAERRLDEAIVEAARAALEKDPTLALARLKKLGRVLPGAPTVAADAVERGAARHVLSGHEDRVESLVYSADGGRLASAARDGRIVLWNRADSSLRVLAGHRGRVVALAFATAGGALPAGMLASAGYDGRVLLWDPESGKPRALGEGAGAFRAIAFDAAGKQLAGVAEDGVRIWTLPGGKAAHHAAAADRPLFAFFAGETLVTGSHDHALALWNGSERRLLEGHGAEIRDAAVSPDGKQLATAGQDGSLRIWPIDGTSSRELRAHDGSVEAVAFTPEGEVVSGGSDGSVRAWRDGASQLLVQHRERIADLAVSPDGRTIASASWDRTVAVFDRQTGTVERLEGHRDVVAAIAFSPDGRELASASWDQDVRVWQIGRDGRRVLRGHRVGVKAIAFDAKSGKLASGGHDDTVRLWNSESGELLRSYEGHRDHVFRVRFSPDGRLIASSSDDRTVRLWSVAGDQHRILEGHRADVEELAFSADGRFLASAGEDGAVGLWDPASGKGRLLEGHRGAVTAIAFRSLSSGATQLASASRDGSVRLWELPSGRVERVIEGRHGEITALAFAGKELVTIGRDDTVRLWSLSGDGSRTLGGSLRGASQLVLAPDGRRIAVAGSHAAVWLCALAGGPCRTLRGHAAAVHAIAFSPDGRWLASASGDNTVRVWDVETGESRPLRGHGAPVFDVAFVHDGEAIASASADTTVRLWPLVLPPTAGDLPAWLRGVTSHVTP